MTSTINPSLVRAARYVKNTGGYSTKMHFLDDHDPVGEMLWREMENAGLVRLDEHDRIWLTDAGDKLLES